MTKKKEPEDKENFWTEINISKKVDWKVALIPVLFMILIGGLTYVFGIQLDGFITILLYAIIYIGHTIYIWKTTDISPAEAYRSHLLGMFIIVIIFAIMSAYPAFVMGDVEKFGSIFTPLIGIGYLYSLFSTRLFTWIGIKIS